jgi:hypothetical protein
MCPPAKPVATDAPARSAAAPDRQAPGAASGFAPPEPAYRPLRGYAIDPSLIGSLATVNISEITFKVPWERLEPGPRGEYVEVVDFDPASGCYYEPVNLDDPRILVQGGLPPSEGTPQFHQQMVYAVAMTTIDNFEHALGRKALWRPGPSPDPARPKRDSRYVQRLRLTLTRSARRMRITPPRKWPCSSGISALSRGAKGPAAKSLRACRTTSSPTRPRTRSSTGCTAGFLLASNADVRAFHEAFADIVALFQHFSFPEIVRHQIAQTGGDLRNRQSLFGNLAIQFGRGRGLGGALRKAIGDIDPKTGKWTAYQPSSADYERFVTPHERGAVLVAAVFDAFLAIYDRRTADLVRLATGGSGVLGPGAIHPDLVNRLAVEATKAAQHVLTMCIRALDYCPPTDIIFSDYLQAILTADYDVLKDDALNYRLAFVEAFRRRGIYPPGSRTLGADSLLWREPGQDDPPSPDVIRGVLKKLGRFAEKQLYARNRHDIFRLQYRMRAALHTMLAAHFQSGDEGRADARFLGVGLPTNDRPPRFEVHSARIAHRAGPDGFVEPRLMLGLLQEHQVPLEADHSAGAMTFESGCTIVAELRTPRVLYCIRKRAESATRLERQRSFAAVAGTSIRATYLGAGGLLNDGGENEPFALLHRGAQ